MNTYTIYADQVEEVRKRLDRLAKKAANYKIPFSYTISEEHPKKVSVYEVDSVTQTIHTVGTYMVAAVDITLTAPTPYGVGFQEGLPAPRSVGYAAILKPQGHLAAA